jgi:hypothetical protein
MPRQRDETKPERHGEPWSTGEENKLIDMLKQGKTKREISIELKRTDGGIHARLKQMAFHFIISGVPIEKVCEIIKIPQTEIEEYVKFRESSEEQRRKNIIMKKEVKPSQNKNDTLEVLIEIRELLKEIVKKLN